MTFLHKSILSAFERGSKEKEEKDYPFFYTTNERIAYRYGQDNDEKNFKPFLKRVLDRRAGIYDD